MPALGGGIAYGANTCSFPGTGDLMDGQPPVREQLGFEHRAGSVNDVPRSDDHEVAEIHEPGRTLTLMVCGRGDKGAWGYLDTSSGVHTPAVPDPDFKAKLRHSSTRTSTDRGRPRGQPRTSLRVRNSKNPPIR